jgi:hypothetical protein
MREGESREYKKGRRRGRGYLCGTRGGAVRGRESDGAPYPIRKDAVSGCSDSMFYITFAKWVKLQTGHGATGTASAPSVPPVPPAPPAPSQSSGDVRRHSPPAKPECLGVSITSTTLV